MSGFLHTPIVAETAACLRFYSRLAPHGAAAEEFAFSARAAPLAGAVVGGYGALALVAARAIGLAPLPAAACAIAALVAITGALHEDGLADTADGFGGGATRERKLEIMRDSRLGAFGGAALVLSLVSRVAALAAIGERGWLLAVAALVCVGAVSRTAGLLPLLLSAPARVDGAGAAMARPELAMLRTAALICCSLSLLPIFAGAHPFRVFASLLGAALASAGVARLSVKQIGGFTGDTLGAAQQAAEIGALLILSGG